MIYTERITINGRAFVRTWSDTHYIERDGIRYAEAIDPADLARTYTETDEELPELTAEEALNIILGGVGNETV